MSHRRPPTPRRSVLGGIAIALSILGTAAPGRAQIAVFDPSNYAQNVLTAARTLQTVNNQVRSLQNETSMLLAEAKNLSRIDFPEMQALTQRLQQIDRLMADAQGIRFKVAGLDQQFGRLFPQGGAASASASEQAKAARTRLDAAMAAFEQTMSVQAGIVENVEADTQTLTAAMTRSQGAEGALQVGQATNQLLALTAKQQSQLQSMMAAQYRADALDGARRIQEESDARVAASRFLGSGTAYARP